MISLRHLVSALTLAALVMSALAPSHAEAQRRRRRAAEPEEELAPLAAAERAYASGELDTVTEHAITALSEGGHAPRDLVRIYFLLGVCATVFGDPDGARDFYQRMLAIDASATLDDTVSPRDRAPYLEARGIVTARPERLAVTGSFVRSRGAVRLLLSDPFSMAHAVRVHARLEGATDFVVSDHDVQADETSHDVVAEVAGAAEAERVEYFAEVLDEYGNQLLVEGDPIEPRVVGLVAGADAALAAEASSGGSVFEDPAFWIIAGGALLVIGGVVTGVAIDQSGRVSVRATVSAGF